jgi:hypothetical protein
MSARKSPAPSRIALLVELDTRPLSNRPYSLGPGGASAIFSRAVEKALVDEIAEQLREGPFEPQEDDSELRRWAAGIIDVFRETVN